MLTLLVGAFAFAPAQAPKEPTSHEAQNPLYKALLDPGLLVGPDVKAKFPAPTMPDGLDAAKQKAVITGLIGNDYSYDEFTRKSVVAPQLLKLRDVVPSDPKAPARGVDVWFVAYGDFKALDDEKFLDRLVNTGRGEGKGKGLTKDDLAKRKITLADEKREAYGHIEFDFLEKVHLKATGRAVWSKTGESVLVAAEIDPRFRGDSGVPEPVAVDHQGRGDDEARPRDPVGRGGVLPEDHEAGRTGRVRCSSSSTSFSRNRPAGSTGRTCCARSSRSSCRTTSGRCARKLAKGAGK